MKHINPELFIVYLVLYVPAVAHTVVFVVWTVCNAVREVKRLINQK